MGHTDALKNCFVFIFSSFVLLFFLFLRDFCVLLVLRKGCSSKRIRAQFREKSRGEGGPVHLLILDGKQIWTFKSPVLGTGVMYENPKMWNLNTWGWTIWICTCGKFYYGKPFTLGQTSIWGKFMVELPDLRCKIGGRNWIRQKTQPSSNCIADQSFHFHVHDFSDVYCHSKTASQIHVAPRISKTVSYFISSNLVGYDHILDICRKTNS